VVKVTSNMSRQEIVKTANATQVNGA